MPKTIISDTSCFIILTNIGELDLLNKIYGRVITTAEVVSEYGEPLPQWVEIETPADKHSQQLLELQLDKGEASAIALAIETAGSTIILDDYKARKVAERLGLTITGTLGIIIKAKLRGIIVSVKPYLEKMRKTGFYLSPEVEQEVLKAAEEV